ncbi:MAG TPA: tRNA (N6-isopentenyl adenosine(37)-C2)-methylthiotransferase MiaB [Chitinophagales bacterium]|nr:tRNA (N6-isopentenyl adenosine(37)-C2)-methylthiotransferase MiaB [Chitinophagales bacterium]HMU98953.1 tRNA (N6-isopentenyl adenosine(37)-C2)-methylthiotransferase MiaB [Chitinophagales bacterium]HMV02386.1 tRNA (N6-isopentenyl adenosine(37)-C2)-methylthiotransferase MiaB [Chitinophagales bacterium]HMW95587.1 tRNA (N6-isopentenyl adenosine(37)-C2)-methylthiotransferase MiaB [Chitinophagales bacterium]HMY43267.1 tRNA (N6-isopentenyl adenosine(37)-C2)-methylthiotransferase MiaB [Chitinophagal
MEELLDYVKNKQHDESRQGEALNIELEPTDFKNDKYFYIESYGCQMNFSDSEIVASILAKQGYSLTADIFQSDLILLNTCAVRDKAEQTVRKRLQFINELKEQKPGLMIGMLGCMAERLKSKLLEEEKLVDIVVGPDAYRSLPELIAEAEGGQKAVNVLLSREETYADISPVRLDKNGVTAFISIMRGCDNMCSFCVVPFTRGRERSRDPESIVAEAEDLFKRGYKEVTLLGQNVDSYAWRGEGKNDDKEAEVLVNFAQLLEKVALVNPDLRVRFSTSHPKDITDDVLYAIAKYENICKYIHLPVQSGSSSCLKRMNRTYDRDWYINRVDAIKRIIPDCGLSSDMIAGFCGETEAEHQDTLSMMDYVRYDYSYMFYYSERPGTLAARKYPDDVEESVKKRRLQEIIDKQNQLSVENNRKDIGKIYKVLIEKTSKKSTEDFSGRNSQNKMIVFPRGNAKIGDYVNVLVESITQGTLIGKIV